MYQVVESDGIYETLAKQYSEIAGATEKDYGTEAQWNWLSSKMQDMARKKRKEKQKNCFMYLATEGDIFHAEEREQKQYRYIMEYAKAHKEWKI